MAKKSKYSGQESEYKYIAPRTHNQRMLVELIKKNTVTICQGLPGTGKTLLSLQEGIFMLKEGEIDKIYYVRNDPLNKYGSKGKGYLPGTAQEKMAPLLAPIMDNIYQVCSKGKADYIISQGQIEGLMFEDLRGRSFQKSFIILDEGQNTTPIGIYTALTRIGQGTKMVLLGDKGQKDSLDKFQDGLADAWKRLDKIPDIGKVSLGINDIFRNKLIKDIVNSYKGIL